MLYLGSRPGKEHARSCCPLPPGLRGNMWCHFSMIKTNESKHVPRGHPKNTCLSMLLLHELFQELRAHLSSISQPFHHKNLFFHRGSERTAHSKISLPGAIRAPGNAFHRFPTGPTAPAATGQTAPAADTPRGRPAPPGPSAALPGAAPTSGASPRTGACGRGRPTVGGGGASQALAYTILGEPEIRWLGGYSPHKPPFGVRSCVGRYSSPRIMEWKPLVDKKTARLEYSKRDGELVG